MSAASSLVSRKGGGTQPLPHVWPQPWSVRATKGTKLRRFGIDASKFAAAGADARSTRLLEEKAPAARLAIDRLTKRVRRNANAKGGPLDANTEIITSVAVSIVGPEDRVSALDRSTDYAYNLTVPATGGIISVQASTSFGIMYAFGTLGQLLDHPSKKDATIEGPLEIVDRPFAAHRGLLVDVSRHFLPVALLKRTVTALSASKFNVLHLHLTDSQAFPVSFPSAPELAEHGAHAVGQVYTADDLKDVVSFSALHGVRVVPELDVPAHTLSWGKSHPELLVNCSNEARRAQSSTDVPALDPSNPKTLDLVKTLLRDVADIFPDDFIHLGSDEVKFRCWLDSPRLLDWGRQHFGGPGGGSSSFLSSSPQLPERRSPAARGPLATVGRRALAIVADAWASWARRLQQQQQRSGAGLQNSHQDSSHGHHHASAREKSHHAAHFVTARSPRPPQGDRPLLHHRWGNNNNNDENNNDKGKGVSLFSSSRGPPQSKDALLPSRRGAHRGQASSFPPNGAPGGLHPLNPSSRTYVADETVIARRMLGHFLGAVTNFVRDELHKTPVVWQEGLEASPASAVPPGAVVETWRCGDAERAAQKALSSDRRVVDASCWYLDWNSPWRNYLSKKLLRRWGMPNEFEGGEAALWTEHVDHSNFDCRAWPRAAAVAHLLWRGHTEDLAPDVETRLDAFGQYLARTLGVKSARLSDATGATGVDATGFCPALDQWRTPRKPPRPPARLSFRAYDSLSDVAATPEDKLRTMATTQTRNHRASFPTGDEFAVSPRIQSSDEYDSCVAFFVKEADDGIDLKRPLAVAGFPFHLRRFGGVLVSTAPISIPSDAAGGDNNNFGVVEDDAAVLLTGGLAVRLGASSSAKHSTKQTRDFPTVVVDLEKAGRDAGSTLRADGPPAWTRACAAHARTDHAALVWEADPNLGGEPSASDGDQGPGPLFFFETPHHAHLNPWTSEPLPHVDTLGRGAARRRRRRRRHRA